MISRFVTRESGSIGHPQGSSRNDLQRAASVLVLFALAGIGRAPAQQPTVPAISNGGPAFEAASIKVNKSDSGPSGISGTTPGRFVVTRTPLKFVILYAYQLLNHQVIGLPDWTEDINFDITAVYKSAAVPADKDVRAMVQGLLRDRFGLLIHPDRRVIPAYDLNLAHTNGKPGPKMTVSSIDCEKMISEKTPLNNAGGPSAVAPGGIRPACKALATRRYLTGGGLTMQQLTSTLQSMVGRPVVDRTGLKGSYDVEASWTLMDDTGDAPQNDSPSIFTALQEQLGLKLDTRREPFDVIVIDRVTLPTDN